MMSKQNEIKSIIRRVKDSIPEPKTINKTETTSSSSLEFEHGKQKIKDQEQDRELKKQYATWMRRILIGQLTLMNIIIILVGCRLLNLDSLTLQIFMGGTLAEAFGVILVITKSLFPNSR